MHGHGAWVDAELGGELLHGFPSGVTGDPGFDLRWFQGPRAARIRPRNPARSTGLLRREAQRVASVQVIQGLECWLRLALATVHPPTHRPGLRRHPKWASSPATTLEQPGQPPTKAPPTAQSTTSSGWPNHSSRSPTGAACSVSTSPVVVNCMQRHDPTVRPHHLLDSAPAPPT